MSIASSIQPGISISLSDLIKLQGVARTLELASHKKVATPLMGGHISSLRGRGIDFDEVRIYQAGDDIRRMDWRVTARTGKAHTKLYHEERERPVFLVLDLSPSMFFGTRIQFKSVLAAQLAALLGWSAIQHGDRLGAVLFTQDQLVELRPRSRKQGILPILKALATLSANKTTAEQSHSNFSQGLARLRRVAKPGSLIFLISDFYQFGATTQARLQPLAKHCEIIACGITDPIERTAPPPDRYAISNQQQVLRMDTRQRQFRTAYAEQFNQHWHAVQTGLQQVKIPLLMFGTEQNPVDVLQQYFLQRKKRRGK